LLSAAEVTACYENTSVPITDQWSNCVTDLDFAFANPEQSLQIQSRSGAGDATASVGVSQVTPIEQVNTNKLSVGGTTPLVGIGLAAGTAPATPLDIKGTTADTTVTIGGGSATVASIQLNGGTNGVDNSSIQAKYSLVLASNSTNAVAGRLVLFKNGTTEHMRIDSAGQVGIRVTPESWESSFAALQITSGGYIAGRTSDITQLFLGANAYYDSVDTRWEYIGSGEATRYYTSEGAHHFQRAISGSADAAITWVDGLTIDSAGLATFSNGINLGDENLDTYDEGTFTATLTATTPPTTPPTATGTYVKVGKVVTFAMYFYNVDTSGASGAMKVTGMPFAAYPVGPALGGVSFYNFTFNADAIQTPDMASSATEITFLESNSNSSWTALDITAGASRYMKIAGSYITT